MKIGTNANGVWVEEYDTDAGTYTRRNPDGTVLAQRDTGQFATNAGRDAAIRACARAIVALVRLTVRRLDAAD